MPSEIGFKLNRVYRASITAGEIGNGFLAIQVYSSPGNPIYVDGLHVGIVAATTADANLVTFKTARLVRDTIFQTGVSFNTTLASRTPEEYWAHCSSGVGGGNEDFQEPVILEAGYTYTLLFEGPVVSGAPAANLTYFAEIRGRTIPDKPVEPSPVVLRSGITEGDADQCSQVSEG
jgi:hypothetical protein